MDITTILGLIVGAVCLFLGLCTFELLVDNLRSFIDVPSIMIVGGGTIAAILISYPLRDILRIPEVIMVCLRSKTDSAVELINKLVQFAEVARRDGILALEGVTEDIKDDFLVRGIQLAVDGTDPELIEQIMTTELDNLSERHSSGKRIFDTLTKYAPAWGLIGTVIGLIQMLGNLAAADPGKIGAGMAVALVTTFYGATLANFVFGPVADKCAAKQDEEMLLRNIVVRGVLAIQSGDNPRIVEQKLRIFLPPRLRAVESRQ